MALDRDNAKFVKHYDAQYQHFAQELYAAIRREAMGEDIGQNGWLTADEQATFVSWLSLDADSCVLDVACGSGQPTIRMAKLADCRAVGIDLHEDGVANAQRAARDQALADRVQFLVTDASAALPFGDEMFDAVICVDAINHLPNRARVLGEWRRVLRPGGRLVFTDPIVITGPISDEEMRIRSSIGYFLFMPFGVNERMLGAAGFDVEHIEDRTENIATVARRWYEARGRHGAALRQSEGEETYDGQQRFFDVAATLAEERRLSRFAFLAVRS